MKKTKHALRLYSAGSTQTRSQSTVDPGERHVEPRANNIASDQNVVKSDYKVYSITADQTFDELISKFGAHKQGMNPRARDIEVPRKISPREHVSQFTRSVLESKQVSDNDVLEYKRLLVSGEFGTYEPVSNIEK